jgi:hypothetical protein
MAEEVKNENTEQAASTEAQAAPASGPVPTPGVDTNQETSPDLNINDLNAVRSIIDIATTRGAFKANELEAVGKTYNKLTTFLDHVTKQQQTQQGEK